MLSLLLNFVFMATGALCLPQNAFSNSILCTKWPFPCRNHFERIDCDKRERIMMFEVQKFSIKRFSLQNVLNLKNTRSQFQEYQVNLQNVLNFMNTRSQECADGGRTGRRSWWYREWNYKHCI